MTMHIIDNPLKELRTELGWTQEQLANHIGVDKHFVLRCEQGLYSSPNPKIMKFFVTKTGRAAEYIEDDYHKWQHLRRQLDDTQKLIRAKVTLPTSGFGLSGHPLLLWRHKADPSMSQIDFCKRLATHPFTVARYEEGRQRAMPGQLYNAFKDAGMEIDYLTRLARLGVEYHDYVQGRR
jgi:transcriptional regulator with XRE-family HTH domain